MSDNYIYPELSILAPGINKLLCSADPSVEKFEIISRQPMQNGVNMSEVLICRKGTEEIKNLFCKYETAGNSQRNTNSHRVGVEYEANVYKEILSKYKLNAPHFYGVEVLEDSDILIMVLDYLPGYVNVSSDNRLERGQAAAVIGKLHKQLEGKVPPFVRKYSKDFFLYWMNTFEEILEEAEVHESWLIDLCNYFKGNIHLLLDEPLTLVHGEYYSKNILVKNGHVCPIDWESAACGVGEIDLAALIDNRPYAEYCIEKYIKARWTDPGIHLEFFHKRLLMARLYFYFRWLSKKRYKGIKSFLQTEWVSVGLKEIGLKAGCY